jgi:hypothetical protein
MTDTMRSVTTEERLENLERRARRDDRDFLLPRDGGGLVLDFHSFRHGYVTAICRANVSPRVMMELARHSDPRLTMKRYSRVAVADSAAALACLPRLTAGPDIEAQAVTLRATGSDAATAAQAAPDLRRGDDPSAVDPMGQPDQVAAPESPQERPGRFAIPFAKSCQLSSTDVDFHGRESMLPDGDKTLANTGEPAYSWDETQAWRGGRAAEGDGLLNRCTGSNPYPGFESQPLRSTAIRARGEAALLHPVLRVRQRSWRV